MPPDFPPAPSELIEEFQEMPDWDERWEYIIELGRELPELPSEHMIEANLVHGCMSTVWLVTSLEDTADGSGQVVSIQADSDSLIVKGLIVVLLGLFDKKSPEHILKCNESDLFEQLGLDQHLSPNRRNGLFSMVKRIRQLAVEQ